MRIGLLGFEDAVNDGNKKRQRLARPGPRCDHIALPCLGLGQCLELVHIQVQVRRLSLGFSSTEDVCAMRVEHGLLYQLLGSPLPLVVGVDLNQRLWPITATVVLLLHRCQDVLSGNLGETSRERAVFVDEPIAEIKDVIHAFSRNGA